MYRMHLNNRIFIFKPAFMTIIFISAIRIQIQNQREQDPLVMIICDDLYILLSCTLFL